tara:strand:- start:2053 stop:3063 length:1011 start_codon:yes stop_codon:yes gene_type:complete
MQTRQYKDLFALSTHLIGAVALTADEQTQLASFIDRRFFEAFRKSPFWPRYMVYGEPRDIISLVISGLAAGTSSDFSSNINGNYILIGQDNAGNGAVAGTNVYYNPAEGSETSSGVFNTSVIYKRTSTSRWEIERTSSVVVNADGTVTTQAGSGTTTLVEADTVKKDNPSQVTTWTLTGTLVSGTPLIEEEQFIPYTQTGKGTIGDFIRIHKTEPFMQRSAREYDFFTDADGAHVKGITISASQQLFVTYKKPFDDFGLTSGYTTSTQAVPEEFYNYIAHAAYADFLTLQGKVELAQTESVVAEKYLDLELEKLSNINGANTLSRISTHLSRQRRK